MEIINAIEGINLIDIIETGFVEYSKGNSVVPPAVSYTHLTLPTTYGV
mgnify:CR=1 FL=1